MSTREDRFGVYQKVKRMRQNKRDQVVYGGRGDVRLTCGGKLLDRHLQKASIGWDFMQLLNPPRTYL